METIMENRNFIVGGVALDESVYKSIVSYKVFYFMLIITL